MLRFLRLTDQEVSCQRVFIRVDFNVPVDAQGHITEDTRIKAALPGIRYCLQHKAALMLTSHFGRPVEGEYDEKLSLAPIAQRLENCRFNVGEKNNNPELAKKIAALCDIYVNDAFGTAHRAEATTYGVAQFAEIACAGPLLAAELDALGAALSEPKRPMVAIVAGSKVSTKLTILNSLAEKVDQLIVGGGIANTFMAAMGLPIGKSLCEPNLLEEARTIIQKMQARGAQVPIPSDVVVGKQFAPDAQATLKKAEQVEETDMIFDIGPDTTEHLAHILERAGTIVWNGPMGVFEFDQFGKGTERLAQAIANSKAFSIAGGGDTLAAIAKYNIADQISYISTGGGAFLEFLEGKTLPAVDILQKRAS